MFPFRIKYTESESDIRNYNLFLQKHKKCQITFEFLEKNRKWETYFNFGIMYKLYNSYFVFVGIVVMLGCLYFI